MGRGFSITGLGLHSSTSDSKTTSPLEAEEEVKDAKCLLSSSSHKCPVHAASSSTSGSASNVLFVGDQEAGRTSLISVVINPNKGMKARGG